MGGINFMLVLALCCVVSVQTQVVFDDEPEQSTPARQFTISIGFQRPQQNSQQRPQQNSQQRPQQNFQRPPQNFQQQSQQQNFQRPNNGFGQTPNSIGGFGPVPNNNGGFGQSSNNGFGQNPNNGFGQSPNNNNNNNGFGQSSNNGFGQNPNNGFGQSPNNGFQNQNPGFQNSNNFQQSQSNSFQQTNPNNFQSESGFQNQNSIDSSQTPDCQTFENTGGHCTSLASCGRLARIIQNRPPLTAARILRRSICGFSGVLPSVCCPSGRHQQQQRPRPPPPQEFGNNNFGNGDGVKNNNNNQNPSSGNNGPGLVIIPPPRVTSAPPTTTPFPIQVVTQQPAKKPPPSSSGGLIIGDGPIALLPPSSGSSSSGPGPLGYSDQGLPPDCGFSDAKHTRIVGGKDAEKGAWPWIAALGYKDQAGNVDYLCGGALISPNYIVTASHCLHGRDDLATIRLGDHDIYSDSDGVTPLDVEVDKKILHPNYDPSTFKNDIGLIRLKKPVPFSRQIHSICLPSSPLLRTQKFENTSPYVSGWGAIQFNGPASSVLREVQIPTVDDSVCQEKYESFKTAVVDDTNICAGLQTGGKDACQGDSGGPLQLPVSNSRYILIGVVSFGFKCAEPNFPGVYTRVTSHLDWLQSTIKQ